MQLPGKMKAIMKAKPAEGAELVEVPVPKPGPRDVLVKVQMTSICGTDVHIYNWDSWAQGRIKPPLVFGHEFAGEVVAIGEMVTGFKPGDFISAESHIPCGVCFQCRTDMQHICGKLKILGVDTQGCFADYIALPEVCAWKNDKSMKPESACIQEPLGNAVYATLAEDITGRSVAVMGCGPAGCFTVGVASGAGAGKIIHVIKHEFRREISKKMGSHIIFKYDDPQLVDKVMKATDGVGVEVVMEMTGNQLAIDSGLKMLAKGGRFTAFGIPSGPIQIDLSNGIVFKGGRILGINGREMYKTWFKMAGLLNSGKLDPSPVITHKFPLKDFKQAFDVMRAKDRQSGKIILVP
ncbi:MAG: L-threonine 3-dehydrogenase [Planctomycetota bacterium]|nr:L-threonine 3-dehydrogenase [Planctomycetota bacterium]